MSRKNHIAKNVSDKNIKHVFPRTYGHDDVYISKEEIVSLLEGETLSFEVQGEYTVTLKLEEEKLAEDEHLINWSEENDY